MHKPFPSGNTHFQARASRVGALQFPSKLSRIALSLAEFSKGVHLPIVPQHGLAKYQAKRHFINQRLEGCTLAPRVREMDMRPGPEISVPVSAVVTLHPIPQRLAAKRPVVQRNLA